MPEIYLTHHGLCDTTQTFPNGLVVHDSSRSSFYNHLERIDLFNLVADINFTFRTVEHYVKFKKVMYTKLGGSIAKLDNIRITDNDNEDKETWFAEDDTDRAWRLIDDRFYHDVSHFVPVGEYGKYTKKHQLEDGGYYFRWYGADVEKVHCDSFDFSSFIDKISKGMVTFKLVHRTDNTKMSIINDSQLKAPGVTSRDIKTVMSYSELIDMINSNGCYIYFWCSNNFEDIMFSIVMDGTVVDNQECHVFISVDVHDYEDDTCVDNLYECMKLFSECSGMSVKQVYQKVDYMITSSILYEQILSKLKSIGEL